jgi:hypothetical protein
VADVKLKCPSCQSDNTLATYVHDPCEHATQGTSTIWTEEAMGPTPDGTPNPRPCPAPGDGTMVPASFCICMECYYTWYPPPPD